MDDKYEQFISITGATVETAKFFLESTNGDVPQAVDAYFQEGPALIAQPQEAVPIAQERRAQPPPVAPVGKPASSRARGGGSKKIASLSDFNNGDPEEEEDDSNEYYAGGEKSGQVVRGGDKKGKHLDDLFESARQSGAEHGAEPPIGPTSRAFTGRARTLGGNNEDSQPVREAPQAAAEKAHTITFWANDVFTVNDGPPRGLTDPASRPFLEAIKKGEIPPELFPELPNTPVNITLVRHNANYEPPAEPRHVAFSGEGRTLAGEAPSSSRPAAQPSAVKPSGSPTGTWEGVKQSQPTTSIQIRLADGSRLVAQFNHCHTVGDIRRFLAASRPDLPAGYVLMTAFPSAQLTDDSKTISECGLLNAVVIQK